jgi:DNA-binding NtrC family response regulator/tetratricopeptide (TPR) repeat protein
VLRFDREQAAMRRGDLRETLRLLRASDTTRFSRDERRLHRVLLAEALLLRGDVDEALRAAASASADAGPPDLQARALVVRGVVLSDTVDLAGAVAVFRQAVDLARNSGHMMEVARAQTRMVAALAERLDAAQLAALAPDIRENVVRCGDHQVSTYFNVTQSRIQAKAGGIDEAWHHLDLAAATLQVEPSHVLDALHAFTATLLCSLACRYTDAVHKGRRALHEARVAGYGRLVPRIHANLALALVHLGHVDEAETLLDEALESPSISAEARIAMLDSKAQICLLRHDVDGCRALLAVIDEASRSKANGWTWVELARQETRTRMLMLWQDFDAAAATASDARVVAQARGDRLYTSLFGALEADARIHLGDLDAARDLIDASTTYDPSLPLAIVVERERVRANLARAGGDTVARSVHEDRARRLVLAAGTAQQRDTLLQDRWNLDAPGAGASRGALPQETQRAIDVAALDTVGHLLACAGHPTLLAAELAAVITRTVEVGAIRLVTYDEDDRVVATLMLHGTKPAAERPTHAWPVGVDRAGRHELQVWPGGGTSRAALSALAPIAEAAVALVTDRRRGSAASRAWSEPATSEALSGVFGSAMRTQVQDVIRAAGTDLPVLLTGETGTGKELVARELHRLSRAATGPFLPFNCAAVPREMLESQLFGHRRGAFTGANADFKGVVSEAAGGSLFLDEIGELDVTLQPKLLRFLETGELQRLGEARPVPVNVRTLAATNANVEEMLRTGRFREDLFYRLNVIHLHLPPLRDRREDVPALARHFLDRLGRETGKLPLRLASSAMELLVLYDWPGNVRELLNEMRRLTAYGEPDELITPERLSRGIRTRAIEAARRQDEVITVQADLPLDAALSAVERAFIARAFKVAGGRVTDAAGLLGLSRKGLFLKRRRLGLD